MISFYQTDSRRQARLKSALLLAGCCATTLLMGAGGSAQAETVATATTQAPASSTIAPPSEGGTKTAAAVAQAPASSTIAPSSEGGTKTTTAVTQSPASSTAAAPLDGGLETVVVSARKRDEKLLDVPVAITAFTSRSLEERGIASISDLTQFTPGFTLDTNFNGRNDRSYQQLVIRGMIPSSSANPTTTIFVDGTPLISGSVDGLDDLERVEVLKGPQSTYFGKETFAGAINLVTRDPGSDWSLSGKALAGSSAYFDERVAIEGGILPNDLLNMRVSGRYFSREGSWANRATPANAGYAHLGNQSSQDFSLILTSHPVENLRIKATGMYSRDDDGPSAQGLILPSQANCLGGLWFCGEMPGLLPSQPAANTVNGTPFIQTFQNFLNSPLGQQKFAPLNNHYGLGRESFHGSLNMDYYIPAWGVTLTSLSGFDSSRFSEMQDILNFDGTSTPNPSFAQFGATYSDPYYDEPFFVEQSYRNVSQEFRLTSDADQRFRYMVGVNYAWTRLDSSLGGGTGMSPVNLNFGGTELSGKAFFLGNTFTDSRNSSAFFGLNYDITDALTISGEGRYSIDAERGVNRNTNTRFKGTYHRFSPRVSVNYKIDPDLMVYTTFSQGVNSGNFNPGIVSLPAAVQATLAGLGATVQVSPEAVTNFEGGVKGSFFDNSVTLAADVYYDVWSNQIVNTHVIFTNPVTNLLQDTTALINNGKSHLWGIEADATWHPVDHLDFNASFALNSTEIVAGPCYACSQRTGTSVVNGNQLPDVSKYQLALGAQYGNTLTENWDWFARVDYSYKSKNYQDKDNLVYAPDQNFVNLKVGVTSGNLRIEAFVDNITNNDKPVSVNALSYLALGYVNHYSLGGDSLIGGLPRLRTVGIRVSDKFGL